MSQAKRPNILWISYEDTNPFYGCYGDPIARTPNTDALAAQGIRYTRAFSTAGVCAPARCAIITGMYAASIGAHHMRTSHARHPQGMPTPYSACPPHYVKCFSEYLRAEGYYCSNNDKTDYQFTTPLSAWHDCSRTGHWRNRRHPDQPFFSVFNFTTSHESGMWDDKPHDGFDPAAIKLPPYFPDTPKVRLAMARMYRNIADNDRRLGEILRQLDDDGLADNTIVMHWSDHGPLPRGKRWPYDSGIRVPLIVRAPGLTRPGAVSDELVSTIDLGPTVLSLCGLTPPTHMQGQVFMGPRKAPPRRYIYATRDRHDEGYDMVRALRDERLKYIRHYYPANGYFPWNPYQNHHPIQQEWWRLHLEGQLQGPQKLMFAPTRPAEELYDTAADPWEIDNLAGRPEYDEDLHRLRAELTRWQAEIGDQGHIAETDMKRAWYHDNQQPTTTPPEPLLIGPESPGYEPSSDGGRFKGPLLVHLHCRTQGASVLYTLDDGQSPCWELFTSAFRLDPGRHRLRAMAERIGYQRSPEISVDLTVT